MQGVRYSLVYSSGPLTKGAAVSSAGSNWSRCPWTGVIWRNPNPQEKPPGLQRFCSTVSIATAQTLNSGTLATASRLSEVRTLTSLE